MVKLYLNYFPHSKMAISEHKNGHFEEIRGWLQILELVSNSTIFHLLFDTYDSPGAVFIWKWEKYRPYLLVCTMTKVFLELNLCQHTVCCSCRSLPHVSFTIASSRSEDV